MNKRIETHEHISSHFEEHLGRVREFMAQASVSAENLGMDAAAKLQLKYFQQLGCKEAEIIETGAIPSVWGYYDAGAPKTLAVYSYFDTNIVGTGWNVDPFEAVVSSHDPFKKVVYGRGANAKGGFMSFLNALESIKAVDGNLPVNLMFVAEGEEFVGSEHIPMIIEKYRHHLSNADACIVPGACQNVNGDVTLFLGNKGNLHIELECSGDSWGKGPRGGPVHSSAQCVVDNPVWRMAKVLESLFDPDTNRVKVEGFYDGLISADDGDLTLINRLAEKYKGREERAIPSLAPGHVEHFVNGERGSDLFHRYCFQPTMNINGLRAGYTGPGTLLWTLPNAAYCTIDHRLPPNLEPNDIANKIRKHLDKHGFNDVTIKILMAVPPQKLSVNDDIAQAGLRVFEKWNIEPTVWPRKGASGPMGFFSQMLGLKVLGATGMGYASGHSAANEFLVVEGDGNVGGLIELEQSMADLLYSYAAYPNDF
jgi:acetylornithine deacetylase/succinyl-diaminopimelate desuccinylase-like protein